MKKAGRSTTYILGLWGAVVAASAGERFVRLPLTRRGAEGRCRRDPGVHCRGHPDDAGEHHDVRGLRGRGRGGGGGDRGRLPRGLRLKPIGVGGLKSCYDREYREKLEYYRGF